MCVRAECDVSEMLGSKLLLGFLGFAQIDTQHTCAFVMAHWTDPGTPEMEITRCLVCGDLTANFSKFYVPVPRNGNSHLLARMSVCLQCFEPLPGYDPANRLLEDSIRLHLESLLPNLQQRAGVFRICTNNEESD